MRREQASPKDSPRFAFLQLKAAPLAPPPTEIPIQSNVFLAPSEATIYFPMISDR